MLARSSSLMVIAKVGLSFITALGYYDTVILVLAAVESPKSLVSWLVLECFAAEKGFLESSLLSVCCFDKASISSGRGVVLWLYAGF